MVMSGISHYTIPANATKYQPGSNVGAERSREAENIIATSSTGEVAGYRVVRQIEAVFVDPDIPNRCRSNPHLQTGTGIISCLHEFGPDHSYR